MRKRIHLLLLVLSIVSMAKAQDFDFEKLDNPTGTFFNQYIGQIGDLAYLSYYDSNFESQLYTYDGEALSFVEGPSGLTYSYLAGQGGDEYYLMYNDANFDNTVVRLDQNGIEILFPIDPNDFFNAFAFKANGFSYFTFFDFNFNSVLRYFDGSQLIDVALPDNNTFAEVVGEINGVLYVVLNNLQGNSLLYAFDGLTFTPINMPFTASFLTVATILDDGAYLALYDFNFNPTLFFFDGQNFIDIAIPPGFLNFGQFAGSINDRLFFTFSNSNFEETLFELEPGGTWITFPNPTGLFYGFSTGPLAAEDQLYMSYYDNNFTATFTIFDGTNLNIVPNPSNNEFNNYYREYKGGHLLSYFDNNFNNQIFYYDNTNLINVASPSGFNGGTFRFQYGLDLFFEFVNANFEGTLFSLALNSRPSSADNTVITERESPYQFLISDFTFSDEDETDTFQGIQIVDLPSKGVLHVSGAQVSPEQTIPVGDLEMLNYLPLDDGIGEPYDSFTFRVFDGLNLSADTYTLYINITPTVNVHNLELAAQLSIYPNPASDHVAVHLEDISSFETLELALTSASGQLLESRRITSSTEVFSTSHLSPGFYQLTIRNAQVNLSRSIIITR